MTRLARRSHAFPGSRARGDAVLAAVLLLFLPSTHGRASGSWSRNDARRASFSARRPNIILFQPDDFPWLSQWPEKVPLLEGNPIRLFRRDVDVPYLEW